MAKDILLIVSKTKQYVKENMEMSIGPAALMVLTDQVIKLLDIAATNAVNDKRQTIKERDIPQVSGVSSEGEE